MPFTLTLLSYAKYRRGHKERRVGRREKVRVKKTFAPFWASARQIADPIPRPAPVTTAERPCRWSILAEHPGVLHDTAAGDVDQAAAGCGDAGHGARNHLDGLRVRRER